MGQTGSCQSKKKNTKNLDCPYNEPKPVHLNSKCVSDASTCDVGLDQRAHTLEAWLQVAILLRGSIFTAEGDQLLGTCFHRRRDGIQHAYRYQGKVAESSFLFPRGQKAEQLDKSTWSSLRRLQLIGHIRSS